MNNGVKPPPYGCIPLEQRKRKGNWRGRAILLSLLILLCVAWCAIAIFAEWAATTANHL